MVFFSLVSVMGWGQELARFNFNGQTLNTTGGYNTNYVLRFHNSNGSYGTAQFDRPGFWSGNYWTYTKQENAYYELTLRTGSYEGIQISFDGELSNSAWSTATWSVYVDYGDGNGYSNTPIRTLDLLNYALLGMNDSGSLNIDFPAAANFNNNWKVKFVAHNFWDVLDNFPQLRMDNLVISHGNLPKIAAEGRDTSNNWANIIEGSSAETFRGTYFGMVITNPETGLDYVDRSFRILNSGNQNLNITGANFTGNASSDFTVLSGIPVIVPAGETRVFTVRFNPSEEGVRNALLNIYSNATPSPFTFYVEGRGASCAAGIDAIRWNTLGDNLNGVSDNLPIQSGTPAIIWGTSRAGLHSIFSEHIYRNNNNSNDSYNLFTSYNHAWYLNAGIDKTVTFGPVPVSSEKGVEISFRLAAVSRASGQQFGSNDYITLEVLKPGTTNEWSKEIRINGGGDNANGSRYSFDQGTTFIRTYAGTGSANYVNNENNTQSTKYNRIVLKIPSTEDFSTLTFRINGITTHANKLWLIDDILVSSESTIFKTYTASGWQMNGAATTVPNRQEKAVIDANLSVTSANPLVTCECQINAGKLLTIKQDGVVTITGKLVNNGNMVVESEADHLNGNLIQIEDGVVNEGNDIVVQRYVEGIRNSFATGQAMDYIYWSSPVTGQKLKSFSPGTPDNRFYYYEELDDYFYPSNAQSDFVPGKGYAIRAESGLNYGYSKKYEFKGVPINGIQANTLQITKSTNGNGYNLIGNPYPSNISANDLFASNPTIYSTVFLWENNVYIPNQQGAGYYGSNYAIYNVTGGVSPTSYVGTSSTPNGIIKVGQGFIVQKKDIGTSNMVFRNNMRKSTGGNFYYRSNKDRFWISLISPMNTENTMLIGYILGASNDYDKDYDAALLSEGSDAVYSILGEEKLAIEGKEFPWDQSDVIPIGVKIFQDGNYKINLKEGEGIFADNEIFIKDKYLNIEHNIADTPYEFEGVKGKFDDRFEIVFKRNTLIVDDLVNSVNYVNIVNDKNNIFVSSNMDFLNEIKIYDILGRMVYFKKNIWNKKIEIPKNDFANGLFIVNVRTSKGQIVSKKIMLK